MADLQDGQRGLAIEVLRLAELAAIERALDRALRDRVPVFVEVTGPAGSGKSRVRVAVTTRLAARDVEVLVASLPQIGEPAPLAVLAIAHAGWYAAAISSTDRAGREIAARRWLEERARQRPVVLLVDDAHAIDTSSRALIEHLRATLANVAVAIVTLSRDAGPTPDACRVTLGRLDDTVAMELARTLAPSAPAQLLEEVVQRAAGNLFFVEELARGLASGRTQLPTTIEALVVETLDHLPPAARRAAIAAAAIGRGFWRRGLARLVPEDEGALDAALGDLERAGLITSAAPLMIDDDYHHFDASVVRDVAYAQTPPGERARVHAAIADWLDDEVATAEQGTSHVLAVAHHRELAGATEAALAAYRRAGKRCLEMFAYREAAEALRSAAALVTHPHPALHEELGDALAESEGYGPAEPVYARALAATADDAMRARLLYKLGLAASKQGNIAGALERFRAGLELASPGDTLASWAAGDPRTPALLWASLGWTLGYLQGDEAGQALCERAVALLEPTPHRRDLAFALSRLGGTYMRACRFAEQLVCNRRNLEIAVELRDLNMQLIADINLGVVHGVLGDLEAAVNATLEARRLAGRLGAVGSDGLSASNLAGFYLELGYLDEADALLDQAIAMLEGSGNRYALPESLVFRARIAARRGDLAAARIHAERSLELAHALDSGLDTAVALRILAQLDSVAGDHAAARRRVDAALALANAHDRFEATRTRAARARIEAIAGEPGAAEELTRIRAELVRLGARHEAAVVKDLAQVR